MEIKPCEIKDSKDTSRSHVIKSANFASNLKYHLDEFNSEIGAAVRLAEKGQKKIPQMCSKPVQQLQQTLQESFAKRKCYDTNSLESKKITDALTLFLRGTMVSLSTIDNPLFRNLLFVLDKRYIASGRKKMFDWCQIYETSSINEMHSLP